MPRNVEWKGRLADLQAAVAGAKSLGVEAHSFERQVDTYFRVPRGRLKLRRRWVPESGTPGAFPDDWSTVAYENALPSELIAYRRPDRSGARASDYVRVRLQDGATMLEALQEAVGVDVTVEKTRLVFLHDDVRIHLDDVKGCGTFLELEAIVGDRCDDDAAGEKVRRLLAHFGLSAEPAIAGSYRELVRGE